VSILLEGGRICHSCPLIWSCPAAQDVWGSSPLIFQKSCSWGTSFLSTFASFLMCCNNDDLDLLAVLARWIWLRRNTLLSIQILYSKGLLMHLMSLKDVICMIQMFLYKRLTVVFCYVNDFSITQRDNLLGFEGT